MRKIAVAMAAACWLSLAWRPPALGGSRAIAIEADARQVKRFGRIEFALRASPLGDDPYDPDQIDLRVEIDTPGGRKVTIPGFLIQPHDRRQVDRGGGGRKAEWLYPVGVPAWRARFSPTETGSHRCQAILKDRRGVARSPSLDFECLPSQDRGFIRVSARDRRYLEYDDGTPFFAVGQNVAFVKDSYQTVEMIDRLGRQGANFARVWACSEDWAMAIEARKSGWGRSWAWSPPIVLAPDREGYHSGRLCLKLSGLTGASLSYDPCHAVALRPGTRYRFACKVRGEKGANVSIEVGGMKLSAAGDGRWAEVKAELTPSDGQWWLAGPVFRLTGAGAAWITNLSLTESAGGAELLWEADVNRPLLGAYNQPDCFMLDRIVEAAAQSGVYLQVVLLTRDHYMRLLSRDGSADYQRALTMAKRLLRYAVARWGYSTHIAAWEYFNEMDPGLPTERFYAELGGWLEQIDVNRHLRANSTWHSPSKDYQHPKLDTADMHYYLRPAEGDLWKDAAAAVQERWRRAQPYLHLRDRPLMFSEFGMTDNNWQRSSQLDKDEGFVHLHNALWASALSGFASTVCHWYWDDIHKRDMYGHYGPVARFVADIPYTTAGLRAASAACQAPGRTPRVIGLQGRSCAYLWVQDTASTWWKIGVEGARPQEMRGAAVRIEGLTPGAYRVEWWDTHEGKAVRTVPAEAGEGPLRLDVPPFTGDIAVKVAPAGRTASAPAGPATTRGGKP